MYSSLVCTRTPVGLCVSLTEVKNYLRINNNDDDELITSLIRAATRICESYTGLALLNQEWQMRCDDFCMRWLEMPKRPIYRINFVEQINLYGKTHTLPHEYYEFCIETSRLKFGLPPVSSHIRVNFGAGFGEDAAEVPDDIKAVLKAHIAFLLEARGTEKEFPMSLYDNFKLYKI